jgi:hypothetical protein
MAIGSRDAKDQKFIEMILEGKSYATAARACGFTNVENAIKYIRGPTLDLILSRYAVLAAKIRKAGLPWGKLLNDSKKVIENALASGNERLALDAAKFVVKTCGEVMPDLLKGDMQTEKTMDELSQDILEDKPAEETAH